MNGKHEPTSGSFDEEPDSPRPLWGPVVRPGVQQSAQHSSAGFPSAPVDGYAPPTSPGQPELSGSSATHQDTEFAAPIQNEPVLHDSAPSSSERDSGIVGSGRRTGFIFGLVGAMLLVLTSVVAVAQQMPTPSAAAPAPTQPANQDGSVPMVDPFPTLTPASALATAPTRTPVPAMPAVGSGLVQMAPTAASHPYAASVAALLDRHFTAINQRDYAGWSTTVVAQRAQDQSQSTWLESYQSTFDDSVVINSISSGSTELIVGLSFTSTQNLADAPADLRVTRICWEARWPVADISSGGRIGTPDRGSITKWAC